MKKLSSVLSWIEHNLDKQITVSTLTTITGWSHRYLGTLFNMATGLSPAEYIRQRKLTQAAFMLRESSRSVTDISLMYGFEYLNTFSRTFKCFFGKSPRE
ncbi:AraC family transcriptional regulator, partial [Salmonella enterica]|nr:AraC family transcriptional regulator [Salmonella enterica]